MVRAFDIKTGTIKWTWDPTPAGRTGAANAWAPMSVDAKRDLVFIPPAARLRISTAACVLATIVMRMPSSRCARQPVTSSGSSRLSITICGTRDVASRPELIEINRSRRSPC